MARILNNGHQSVHIKPQQLMATKSLFADLNYYHKTEKRRTFTFSAVVKLAIALFMAAYLLVKFVEPLLVSDIY